MMVCQGMGILGDEHHKFVGILGNGYLGSSQGMGAQRIGAPGMSIPRREMPQGVDILIDGCPSDGYPRCRTSPVQGALGAGCPMCELPQAESFMSAGSP